MDFKLLVPIGLTVVGILLYVTLPEKANSIALYGLSGLGLIVWFAFKVLGKQKEDEEDQEEEA